MKTILLINPPVYDFKLYDEWMNPLGLLYISSILKQAGFKVVFKDFLYSRSKNKSFGRGDFLKTEVEKPHEYQFLNKPYFRYGINKELIKQEMENIDYDIAFVGSFLTYQYQGAFDIIKMLKQIRPEKSVVLGGIYATLCYDHALKYSNADFIVKRKFDFEALRKLGEITGFNINNLKEYDETFDLEVVNYKPYFSLMLSQGCPLKCSFCASNFLQPDRKLIKYNDLNIFINGYNNGIKNLAFFDDALLYNFDYLKKFILDFENKGVFFNYHTPNGLHINQINEKWAKFLKEHNFKTLRFGLEFLDCENTSGIKSKTTIDKLKKHIDDLKNAGFSKKEFGFYLFISPNISQKNIDYSIDVLTKLNVNLHLNLFSPVPQTKDFEVLAEKYPLIKEEPLLHNDSVFIYKYQIFPEKWIRDIKKFIRDYNGKM